MKSAKFDIIKRREVGYKKGYQGGECLVSDGAVFRGTYLVSAKNAVKRFKNYCKGGIFPVFTLENDDAHAVPLPADPDDNAGSERDYQELIDGGCEIAVLVTCSKKDYVEVSRRMSDGRLVVDYALEATRGSARKPACCDGIAYICNSSNNGIILQRETFGVFCDMYDRIKMRLGYSVAYLRVGACNAYKSIRLDENIISSFLGIKEPNGREYFIRELQAEINERIMDRGDVVNLFLVEERLQEMVSAGNKANDLSQLPEMVSAGNKANDLSQLPEMVSAGNKADDLSQRSRRLWAISLPTVGSAGGVQMMQKFADSSVGGRVVTMGCGCLFFAMIGVSVKFGIDMEQHKGDTSTIAFGVSCGVCILLCMVLCAMIIVRHQFSSRPNEEIGVADVTNISSPNADRATN